MTIKRKSKKEVVISKESPLLIDYTPEDYVEEVHYKEWIQLKPGEYIPSSIVKLCKSLQPGMYQIEWDYNNGWPIFVKQKTNLDELLMLPDPIFSTIIKDMEYFWDNENKFKDYKYAYKRGILLYGPPGTGKSSLVALLSETVIKLGGIVVSIRTGEDLPRYTNAIPKALRLIQPNTPILTIIEDIEGIMGFKDNESLLLNILDGIYQSHNVVYLACTNYPERLQDRVLNRPSRFDKRYLIDLPNNDVRRFYLQQKIKEKDLASIDIEDIVKQTEGLSLAHLGEFIKSVFIFNKTISESIGELRDMSKFISSSKYAGKSKTGFGN
jgi:energy-coupling factor transporter ATP-binding protein EcfA2